ncbi:hypothetical protein HOLleu_18184 [Holothuria leucospilota]|uniref:Uncharacterized protein n=1 Tax=Holothuria leucospilota TaxID=206669 RepID=A0A9Q1H998_HOLLE|nr:hypothetical protein HOLleu_18184 [Holothuria leucospilota]
MSSHGQAREIRVLFLPFCVGLVKARENPVHRQGQMQEVTPQIDCTYHYYQFWIT